MLRLVKLLMILTIYLIVGNHKLITSKPKRNVSACWFVLKSYGILLFHKTSDLIFIIKQDVVELE